MTFKLEENEKLIKQASVSLYRAAKLNRDGQLHLTNRRICFAGQGGDSFCYPLDAIISVTFTNVGLIFAQGFTIAFDDQRREHIGAVYNREDWVEKILEAKNEFDPLGHAVPDQDSSFFERFRVELRKKIATHFSDDEIKTLCFDLGIEYENLAGDGREAKARELVIHCERTGRIPRLVDKCQELRPNVIW
jgi:Effector-associated domain 7/GRAM domain